METAEVIDAALFDPSKPSDPHVVPCYDPATMQLLGHVPAMSAVEVCVPRTTSLPACTSLPAPFV